MKKQKIRGFGKSYLAFALILFLISIASALGSTSTYNVQYTSPSYSGFDSSAYSSLMSGVSGRETATSDETFFDMEVFIPPGGCSPQVVRSDLLEEQNVPVFCQLVPLKINPGVDITRLDRVSVSQKNQSPDIAGIGFHPANAAIKSKSSSSSVPSFSNLGYVVVVLKKNTNEKSMPENITTTLAATMQYSADYAFGIGESEFYVPEMTDEDFSNNYVNYGFMDGLGYLRAKDIDEKGATIEVYSSQNKRVFSSRIEQGKTSKDFMISSATGGRSLRITLQNMAIPETKAKIRINSEKEVEVYEKQSFYNGKCTLVSLVNNGLGTGKATIKCGAKTFILERRLNQINLIVGSATSEKKPYALKDFLQTLDVYHYYLVYANKASDGKNYVIVAKFNKTQFIQDSEVINTALPKIVSELDGKIQTSSTLAQIDEIANKFSLKLNNGPDPVTLELISEGSPKKGITLENLITKDSAIGVETTNYFDKTINAFDYVKDTFGTESYKENNGWSYGEASLWNAYILAENLKQESKVVSILSRIENEYPTSKYLSQTATQIASSRKVLGDDEGASGYDEKQGISIELVSITQPSESESGVSITSYVDGKQDKVRTVYHNADIISSTKDYTLKVISFDESNVKVECESRLATTSNEFKKVEYPVALGKNLEIKECRSKIFIEAINLKRVAHITLTPKVSGRSRETNFTFSIGVEKRTAALNLTPAEANSTMNSINSQIADLRNLTESLNETIVTGKLACLGTSLALNLKTLLSGTSGTATARKEVMQRWYARCGSAENLKKYGTVDECIGQLYDKEIKPEIEATAKAMANYNKLFKDQSNLQANKDKNGQINQSKVKASIYATLSNSKITLLNENGEPLEASENSRLLSLAKKENMQYLSNSEVATLYFDIQMMNDNSITEDSKKQYQKDAYNKLSIIDDKTKQEAELIRQTKQVGGFSFSVPIDTVKRDKWMYKGDKWGSSKTNFIYDSSIQIPEDTKIVGVDNIYLFTLNDPLQGILTPSNVYHAETIGDKIKLTAFAYTSDEDKLKKQAVMNKYIFQQFKEIDYKNSCKNCDIVKVFTLEPYRNQPSLLPFDFDNGWYIQVKQNLAGLGSLGTGEQKSYLDSGKLNSFWLCNVGKDGNMDGVSVGDSDICRRFDMYTGDSMDSFPGLTKDQTKTKVAEALRALESAQSQLSSGNAKTIKINGKVLKVVAYNGEDVGSRCTDFMSPGECQLMYNVCDPFVCPSSRCNLGGKYPVDNVIQSGIVGSTVLCLPNFIAFKPTTGVVIPVCLTGIYAGLQSYISILEAYRDCINESTYGNKTVGICDYISSVYVCNFFWNQAGSYVTTLFKNLFLFIKGEGGSDSGGGGEYMFVNDAWNNAEKSSQTMQATYAKDSNLVFGTSSLADTVAAEVCKSSASATYPNKINAMLEPENPVQYQAWFESSAYTSATLTPKSQYKVYYHIYAGTMGHYYQVYLKSTASTTSSNYMGSKSSTVVATGYVQKGGTATETKDFLDDSGFGELCISIDSVEKCGFKSLSSSFVQNYIKDSVVQSQATENVTSESSCVNGGNNLGSLVTANVQQGVSEYVSPEIYNSGIIRVCSSANPGSSTEPSRWSDVGYCTDKNVRCWLDTNSVKKAITGAGIKNQTLAEIGNISIENLIGTQGYLNTDDAGKQIQNLKNVYNNIVGRITSKDQISTVKYLTKLAAFDGTDYEGRTLLNLEEDVRLLDKKLIYSSQRADLWFYKASVYSSIANMLKKNGEGASSTTSTNTNVPVVEKVLYRISSDSKIITLTKNNIEYELEISGELVSYNGVKIASFIDDKFKIVSVPDLTAVNLDTHNFINESLNGKTLDDIKKLASSSSVK